MAKIGPGDVVVVTKLDRLGRAGRYRYRQELRCRYQHDLAANVTALLGGLALSQELHQAVSRLIFAKMEVETAASSSGAAEG